MKINSTDTVAGVSIMIVRDFLRKEGNDAWTLDYVAKALEVDTAVAQEIVQELEMNGFLVSKTRAHWGESMSPCKVRAEMTYRSVPGARPSRAMRSRWPAPRVR